VEELSEKVFAQYSGLKGTDIVERESGGSRKAAVKRRWGLVKIGEESRMERFGEEVGLR